MTVRRVARLAVLAVAISGVGAAGTQAQMRVPASWSRRATLPPFGSFERHCTSTLPETVTVTLSGNRLAGRHDVRDFHWRDPLPYAMDLRDALVDLSGSGLPPWQHDTSPVAPPPLPPPPPPAEGAPAVVFDEAAIFAGRVRQHEWFVRYARDYARRRVIRVSDGWFVGFDGGENGGSLWWYPHTPGPGRLMWRGNVRWLEPVGDDFVAIGGLAHGIVEGFALWLHRTPDGWAVRRNAPLQYAPTAIAKESGGSIAIATMKSLERVTADGLTVLAHVDLPTAPMSLVAAPDGEFALGMSVFAYVLRPGPDGYRAEIYVPPGCDLKSDGLFCRCEPARK